MMNMRSGIKNVAGLGLAMGMSGYLTSEIARVYLQGEGVFGTFGMRVVALSLIFTVFSIFSGAMYLKLSKKEIFKLREVYTTLSNDSKRSSTIDKATHFLQYTVAFPVIALVWVIALALFIVALSKSISAENAIAIAIAIVAATRICAYYSEDIAVDIAKTLPWTILAIAIADPYFVTEQALTEKWAAFGKASVHYVPIFLGLVVMEWALQFALWGKRKALGGGEEPDTDVDMLLEHYAKKKKG